jgi:hypothetical protein
MDVRVRAVLTAVLFEMGSPVRRETAGAHEKRRGELQEVHGL